MKGTPLRASPTHEMLVQLLAAYVSPIVARSVIAAAATRCGVQPSILAGRHLLAVAPEILAGVRALCDASSFEELQRALDDFTAEQLAAKGTWERLLAAPTEMRRPSGSR